MIGCSSVIQVMNNVRAFREFHARYVTHSGGVNAHGSLTPSLPSNGRDLSVRVRGMSSLPAPTSLPKPTILGSCIRTSQSGVRRSRHQQRRAKLSREGHRNSEPSSRRDRHTSIPARVPQAATYGSRWQRWPRARIPDRSGYCCVCDHRHGMARRTDACGRISGHRVRTFRSYGGGRLTPQFHD
jgi:hypothetical protein